MELVWQKGSAPLAGPVGALAEAAGVEFGPPAGVYDIVDPLPADAVLEIDPAAADLVHRSHYAGGHALKNVLPEQHPVLWPEHFDVAATENEVNYGVSAGDAYHPTAVRLRRPMDSSAAGPFWNAPFGALHPLDPRADVDELTVAASSISSSAAARNCSIDR